MKSLTVSSVLVCFLIGVAPAAMARTADCPANLPPGLTIRVFPDEKLTAGITSGPTIFTVAQDIRFFPNRPPLLARGSKILANIVESKQAGHFHGKARARIALTSILTSDSCEYPIDAKIIDAGKNKVQDDLIWGRGHARRDLVALLFPPTTIYQLLRLPSRGPKLVLDNETPLIIKLMQSVSLSAASIPVREDGRLGTLLDRVDRIEREVSSIKTAFDSRPSPNQAQETKVASGECSTDDRFVRRPMTEKSAVIRPVRNLTQYHVSVYVDQTAVMILPPCYGPSMITMPAKEFQLEAKASVLTAEGQKQVPMKIVPHSGGWDIVQDKTDAVAITSN